MLIKEKMPIGFQYNKKSKREVFQNSQKKLSGYLPAELQKTLCNARKNETKKMSTL